MLEFVPQNRCFLLAALSIFQLIGVVLCSAIVFGFIPTRSCSTSFSKLNPLPSCSKTGLEPGVPCCSRESNMGWRYFLYTLGGLTLLVFFLRVTVLRLKEFPKFLIYKGRGAEVIAAVHYISKKNGRPCDLTLADFERLTGEDNSTGASSITRTHGTKQLAAS
ncbi:hypothetical protein F5X98DRAFT_375770 [Xylaria grammica]|nr:hypothetical protein F5X98DRAFT_375770 [Xylaria grammica]